MATSKREEPIIEIKHLSKQYSIGMDKTYKTLSESFVSAVRHPLKALKDCSRSNNTFWALKDVNFEVEKGEVIGIIGKNGAGKSTLLKILSRITYPTEGEVRVHGRIGSLLEVGTGFHPELSGRENIYFNGAILGMKKKEIDEKFDEIVKFSGVEKFLDTPVKRYSSGMQVRLAFSVAANLDPEILVVDEVLAVGDASFQKKCLGKMEDVSKGGRTILFVSHNMKAIRNLCTKVIWLRDGQVVDSGETNEIIDRYLIESLKAGSVNDVKKLIQQLPEDPAFKLIDVKVAQNGNITDTFLNGYPIDIEIEYEVLQLTSGLRIYFDLIDNDQNILIRTFHDEDNNSIPIMIPGSYISKAKIPANLLSPIDYELIIRSTIFNVRSCTEGGIAIPIHIEQSNNVNRAYPYDTIRSKLQPSIYWVTSKT